LCKINWVWDEGLEFCLKQKLKDRQRSELVQESTILSGETLLNFTKLTKQEMF